MDNDAKHYEKMSQEEKNILILALEEEEVLFARQVTSMDWGIPFDCIDDIGAAPSNERMIDDIQDKTEYNTLLLIASKFFSANTVKLLIENGANIAYRNKLGRTALSLAAEFGKSAVVHLLITKENTLSMVNIPDDFGKSPLSYAALCRTSDTEAKVNILLDHQANIDVIDSTNKTPLLIAIRSASSYVFALSSLLVRRGASLDYPVESAQGNNKTPLIEAILEKQTQTAMMLIDNGADVFKFAFIAECPVEDGELEMYTHSKSKVHRNELSGRLYAMDHLSALSAASYANELKIVQRLIAMGVPTNDDHYIPRLTPIYQAAIADNTEVVKLLLKHFAKVVIYDRFLNHLDEVVSVSFVQRLILLKGGDNNLLRTNELIAAVDKGLAYPALWVSFNLTGKDRPYNFLRALRFRNCDAFGYCLGFISAHWNPVERGNSNIN